MLLGSASSRFVFAGLTAAIVAATACPASASVFTGLGSGQASHNPIASSVSFEYNSGVLTVTLKNTSTFDYKSSPNAARMVPTDVLTGLFFDYNGGYGPSLTFTSATTPTITYGSNPTNLKLSATPGGWDFKQSSSSLSGLTQHYGVGTAGFGIFGGSTSSGGSGHPSNFGIVNSLYVNGENNPGIGTTTPYAKDSITFSFTVSGPFDTAKISNVRFQYGTALNEGSTPGTFLHAPEPASLTLFGFGVVGMAAAARRRRQAA